MRKERVDAALYNIRSLCKFLEENNEQSDFAPTYDEMIDVLVVLKELYRLVKEKAVLEMTKGGWG